MAAHPIGSGASITTANDTALGGLRLGGLAGERNCLQGLSVATAKRSSR
jgi:hypothetical protein